MKKLRVGFFGCGVRGQTLSKDFLFHGCEIVAGCELRKNVMVDDDNSFLKRVGNDCAFYTDFDEFLNHGLDIVVLTNNFHEHAPYAVKCLERGIHVFSECISNGTMAEGVELIRAAEKSNAVYFLAENYPQMIFNKEMQKICADGSLGKILYAEGEYNHPVDPNDAEFKKMYIYDKKHWRNHIPSTYYITHSLGPCMKATGATPEKVVAFCSFAPPSDDKPTGSFNGDKAATIITYNDDGSVFRVVGWGEFGAHHHTYRICGTKGQIENSRDTHNPEGKIILRYNAWEIPEGKEEINVYIPTPTQEESDLIYKSGHGGADYYTVKKFLDSIREGTTPEHPFDVYSSVAMASVAILGHRSALEGGKVYDIPDFHKEECRKQYENDRLSPFYGADGSEPTLPACASHPDYKPSEEQLKRYSDMLASFKENN